MKGPIEIVSGVHGLGSEYVNWYLVEEEGRLTAVDAGLPGFRAELEADLGKLGYGPGDVAAVVLTHSDSDHTGLVPALRDAGARVLIHRDDDETLRKPGPKSGDASPVRLVPYMRRPGFWRFMGHMTRAGGAKPPKVEGAETFSDGDVLDVPGGPRVVHTPGHTPGHCALHFARHGALFAGDALYTFNPLDGSRGPQVGPRAFNVSTAGALESLARLEPLDAEVVLVGHGEPWHEGPAAAVARARLAAQG
jgi:glyoxylase-like metal-dependent hydrolase (beta-lactamase superfamily II)